MSFSELGRNDIARLEIARDWVAVVVSVVSGFMVKMRKIGRR